MTRVFKNMSCYESGDEDSDGELDATNPTAQPTVNYKIGKIGLSKQKKGKLVVFVNNPTTDEPALDEDGDEVELDLGYVMFQHKCDENGKKMDEGQYSALVKEHENEKKRRNELKQRRNFHVKRKYDQRAAAETQKKARSRRGICSSSSSSSSSSS